AFPAHQPATADELMMPARDGALRVLNAANTAGVRRIVMTSSVAAVDVAWEGPRPDAFDESHWTNMTKPENVSFYAQSKTIAEKSAWEASKADDFRTELSVVVPTAVLGPAMSPGVSASLGMITAPLNREMPAYPKLHQGIVDVRDLAKAHIEAMRRPEAAGERIIVCSESLWFKEVGEILSTAYPNRKLPRGELPTWLVRMMSRFKPELKLIAPNLSRLRNYNNQKAKDVLGMTFRPAKEAVLASADSLEKLGLI
ncbi:MAG: NAD-dependent epimerase/dehydratase family protein, partial [Boseongicola sp.]|nr:NAD-dependent epimerase/dehydratase family protein [Boseongicola sp.]